MKYHAITVAVDARGVAYLNLARPAKHNAMDARMLDELAAAADSLAHDDAVRALVVSGEGASFCAGADLGWMRENLNRDRRMRINESQKLTRALHRLKRLPKLVIARVNGQAYAGGVGLIAVCDIAIGIKDARFGFTETRLGLVPANIAPYLIERMGVSNARRCMLNAHFFHGDQAARLGLLDESVRAEDLDAAVEKEIGEALACAPGAVAMTKKLLRKVGRQTMRENREYTVKMLADAWERAEAKDGITAFFDKKPPPWKSAAEG